MHLSMSLVSTTKSLQQEILPGATPFSRAEYFQVNISVSAAFLSKRASRKCSEDLEETHLDGVANESAIVIGFLHFCSRD